MDIPPGTAEFVAEWEGFRSHSYRCSAGVWTIGYGTTSASGLIDVKPGMSISEAEARRLLHVGLEKFADEIYPRFRKPPLGGQAIPLISLAYNIGPAAFARSSVLRWFNRDEFTRAADAFLLWNKAGGKVVKGLVRRREAERRMFLLYSPEVA